jgi:hypothetical protein
MTKSLLTSCIVGIVAYLVFAILASLIVPKVFPYPTPSDEVLTQLTWSKRVIAEKLLNLGLILMAGMVNGLLSKSYTHPFLASIVVASIYQLCAISYVIAKWGLPYYLQSNAFALTMLFSLGCCLAGTRFIRLILKLGSRSTARRATAP